MYHEAGQKSFSEVDAKNRLEVEDANLQVWNYCTQEFNTVVIRTVKMSNRETTMTEADQPIQGEAKMKASKANKKKKMA